LSSNNHFHNEAQYVASNIPIFLKNVEFGCSVLDGAETIFG